MAYVLIVAVLTSGSYGGNAIGFHKFDDKEACENAKLVVAKTNSYYGDNKFTLNCVPQSSGLK